jgi:Platelet-activating factor acetylhydrolase, isoform II
MRIRLAATAIAAGLLLGGCFSDSPSKGTAGVGPTNPATGNGSGSIPPTPAGVGAFKALFVAGGGIFPYPTDLYFNGSDDGTLNIPSSTVYPGRLTMNQLDGFSTTASSVFRFSQPVRNDATMLNSNVRIVEMIMLRQSTGVYAPVATSPLRGPNPILSPGVDYSVRLAPETDAAGTEVEIVWLKPLNPSTGVYCPAPLPATAICGIGYIVLVTNGIQNTAATPVAATPDTDYLAVRTEAIAELTRAQTPPNNPATFSPTCPGITNATLNGICRLTYAHLGTGARLPAPATVNPASVIVSYSFTTQSTRDSLLALAAANTARPMTATFTGLNTNNLSAVLPGIADVYAGTLQIPYFMTPPSAGDPTAPLSKYWKAAGASTVPGISATSRDITRFNPLPAAVVPDLRIPTLIFKPNGSSPTGGVRPPNGWPVVIFMHGLQSDRTSATAIADFYAQLGFVVIAIDQVMHGITSTTNPFYAGPANPAYASWYGAGVRERTFDVDYMNNATGASGPDGVIDGSGTWAINISHQQSATATTGSPLVSRDGLRQISSDLITLSKSLAANNLDLDGVAGGDIDATQIHYAGISLGGIAGSICICSDIRSAYLNVPGAPLPTILRTSPAFAGRINAGLAAANPLLVPTAALYSQYFRELQAAYDPGDPANHIRTIVATKPTVLTKVIGDKVVPNGTNDYLILASGATRAATAGPQAVAAGAPRYVTFLSGQPAGAPDVAGAGPTHSSLLSTFGSLAATVEMQTHAVTFAASGGAAFQIVNASLLQQ